jgi:hypothetical protein
MKPAAIAPEEIVSFAKMVAKTYVARGMPRDRMDDVEQLAALSVLETRKRYGLPLKGNRAYYGRGAMIEPAVALAQERAAVHLTEHALRTTPLTQWIDRTLLVGCGGRRLEGAVEIADERRPDEGLIEEEEARARARMWEFLEDHVAAMKDDERQAIKMLLGIGTPARDPHEVAATIGRSERFIWAAARRLGKKVQQDRGAQRARRVMKQYRRAA